MSKYFRHIFSSLCVLFLYGWPIITLELFDHKKKYKKLSVPLLQLSHNCQIRIIPKVIFNPVCESRSAEAPSQTVHLSSGMAIGGETPRLLLIFPSSGKETSLLEGDIKLARLRERVSGDVANIPSMQIGQHSPSGISGLAQSCISSQITSSHMTVPLSHTQIRHGSGFHTSLSLYDWPSSVQLLNMPANESPRRTREFISISSGSLLIPDLFSISQNLLFGARYKHLGVDAQN